MNKLIRFMLATYHMMVAFMLMYLIKLATKYDMDFTGLELVFIIIVLGCAMAAFMYHFTLVLIKPNTERDNYEAH